MPTYCYRCPKCDRVEEVARPICDRNDAVRCPRCEAVLCYRDIPAEHKGSKDTPGCWPMKSWAAGVNPDEIPRAVAAANEGGVPTDFCPKTGDVIFTSRKHRRDYLNKVRGMHDRNAGYGDPAPIHTE